MELRKSHYLLYLKFKTPRVITWRPMEHFSRLLKTLKSPAFTWKTEKSGSI